MLEVSTVQWKAENGRRMKDAWEKRLGAGGEMRGVVGSSGRAGVELLIYIP